MCSLGILVHNHVDCRMRKQAEAQSELSGVEIPGTSLYQRMDVGRKLQRHTL